MSQKDIRTRVAEVEAEAKGLEGIETEEEDEESPSSKVAIIVGLITASIVLYIMIGILPELIEKSIKEIK